MNKKTILNRTLPLIIALFLILIVALLVTFIAKNEKKPMVENGNEQYLAFNVGDTEITVEKQEVYQKLLNSSNSLTYLVNMLDKELLEAKGYVQKVTEAEMKVAVQEDIFGKDYEFDTENLDADNKKIEAYVEKMFLSYGIEIAETSIAIKDGALDVVLSSEDALKDYYSLVLARKAYTREEMGKDQVEAYEEYIAAFEQYLVDLYKFEQEEIKTAPTKPTDGSIITSSAVSKDFAADNQDTYWAVLLTYNTKAEAEQALLQVGVVIYSSVWYEYEGVIDLNDFKDENGKKEYASLSAYYADKGTKLNKFDIQSKFIELYNNAVEEENRLVENVHYTIDTKTEAEYKALVDDLKDEKYTEIKNEGADSTYKAVIFKTDVKLDAEGNVDAEAAQNELYFDVDKLAKLSSGVKNNLVGKTALYADGSSTSWSKCYSTSIQNSTSDNLYNLVLKLQTNEAVDFDDAVAEGGFGKFYDDDKYEDGIAEDKLSELQVGYVSYTRDVDGNLTFNYDGNAYWAKVQELLDDAVTAAKVNEYMAKLRFESDLLIYDKDIEAKYVGAYTSDYEVSKKSSKSVVAKINVEAADGSSKKFEVTAEELYQKLEPVFGGMLAADNYQYHYALSHSDVVDYSKYLKGADLEDCVYIVEYALAKKGSLEPINKKMWKSADHDGEVEFTKVDGTAEYDVLVRKGTKGSEKTVEVFDAFKVKVVDNKSTSTTVKVTVAEASHYHDPAATFAEYDETIEAMKLNLTNGGFAESGYAADYGWKNFLKDYFSQFYGINIESNEDLKVYFLYQDATEHLAEELAELTDEAWNNVYLPYMEKAYADYFSVEYVNFLISATDEEGNISDPTAEDTAWTEEQKAAAEELYNLVYAILRKTKAADQGALLQDIANAISGAPRFVAGVEQTTEAQQEYFDNNPLYVGTNNHGAEYSVMEFTAEFKGITLEVSKYKTLGLKVKYEAQATGTTGKFVEPFEKALKAMWQINEINDKGLQSGNSLEANDFYIDYANEEYLVTEFGYHVVIVNKYTARTSAVNKNANDETMLVTVPSKEDVLFYLENKESESIKDLSDYIISGITTYFAPINKEFAGDEWYQLNNMLRLIENIDELKFASDAAKAQAVKLANKYVETYYEALTYIGKDANYAIDLMDAFTSSYNNYEFANNNTEDAFYLRSYVISTENLEILLAAAEKALTLDFEMNSTVQKEFDEAKAEFEAAKAAFQAK